jgi:hypothetical protein
MRSSSARRSYPSVSEGRASHCGRASPWPGRGVVQVPRCGRCGVEATWPSWAVGDSQGPTRFRSEGSTDAVAGAPLLCRAIAISDAAPGTTCGNHHANSPGHLRASPGMVFAVQLYELTPRAGTRSLPIFALQARGRWFEPSCAHQVRPYISRWIACRACPLAWRPSGELIREPGSRSSPSHPSPHRSGPRHDLAVGERTGGPLLLAAAVR